MEIHGKFVDSLTVTATLKSPEKFKIFIDNFYHRVLRKSYGMEVAFLERNFQYTFRHDEGQRPIRLNDGKVILLFSYNELKNEPIALKILQPEVWENPLQKLTKIVKDLEYYTGNLEIKIERIDISVHFSGWNINHNFITCLKTEGKKTTLILDSSPEKNIETIYLGKLRSDSAVMRLYNKSQFLIENSTKPSPEIVYSRKTKFGRQVWNLEFSYGRKYLENNFSTSVPSEIFELIPLAWQKSTTEFTWVAKKEGSDEPHENWIRLSKEISSGNKLYFKRKTRKKKSPNISFRKDQLVKKAKSLADAIGISKEKIRTVHDLKILTDKFEKN